MFTRILLSSGMLYLTCFQPVQAEILDVRVTWTAAECQARCNKLLLAQFGKIYGVSSVQVNQAAGQADLKWKPKVIFSFRPIDSALRMVGPFPNDVRVKVRGKIQHDPVNVKIISDGDGTSFYLLNPIIPSRNQFVIEDSAFNRSLTPDMRNKLIEAQKNNQMVTIEGPLFEPYRSPPLRIVVESLNIEEVVKK